MTSYRRHAITGEPVIFAPERADRPGAFVDTVDRARCPFCAGHEEDTPPEILRVGTPWKIRVVPNKYPSVPGAEVIIESPDHDATFDRIEHTAAVVRVYVERHRAHAGAAHVALFKNEGARAGSSIQHLHSQLMPLPFVPPRVERELAGFAHACPLCDDVADDLVIRETSAFTWFTPYASSTPYQQWIVPKRHTPAIAEFTSAEIDELASLLRSAAAATRGIADAFNWMFMTFPPGSAAHCYLELFPRMTTLAGLELGTGTFVEIVDPVAAARRLRS